jgi:hypothetical protein
MEGRGGEPGRHFWIGRFETIKYTNYDFLTFDLDFTNVFGHFKALMLRRCLICECSRSGRSLRCDCNVGRLRSCQACLKGCELSSTNSMRAWNEGVSKTTLTSVFLFAHKP